MLERWTYVAKLEDKGQQCKNASSTLEKLSRILLLMLSNFPNYARIGALGRFEDEEKENNEIRRDYSIGRAGSS